jgi:methyl-accepting chemotaxis protein
MNNLITNLQKTITNLEKLRDLQDCPQKGIILQLDKLYQQKLELIGAEIDSETEKYKSAVASMEEAAKITKEAIDNIEKVDRVIKKVADATDKIAPLISQIF